MTTRRTAPYLLRAVLVNGLIVLGFVQVQRAGRVTNGVLAMYVFLAVVANAVMFFGARARKKLAGRNTRS